MSLNFPRTKAALAVYDASASDRNLLWETSNTNDHAYAAEMVDNGAMSQVRAAFYLDTCGINRLIDCMRVPLDYMRKCVAEDVLPRQARLNG